MVSNRCFFDAKSSTSRLSAAGTMRYLTSINDGCYEHLTLLFENYRHLVRSKLSAWNAKQPLRPFLQMYISFCSTSLCGKTQIINCIIGDPFATTNKRLAEPISGSESQTQVLINACEVTVETWDAPTPMLDMNTS